jgi:hypothetical protein
MSAVRRAFPSGSIRLAAWRRPIRFPFASLRCGCEPRRDSARTPISGLAPSFRGRLRPMTVTKGSVPCRRCGRHEQLRRGLCPACYQRWRRGTTPAGGRCEGCGATDGRVLKALALGTGEKVTVCYNCAQLAGRQTPRPTSAAELRELVAQPGERRRGVDRRTGERRQPEGISFGPWDRRNKGRRGADRPRSV